MVVRVTALVVVFGAVAALLVPVPALADDGSGAVTYEHPVDAEIIDGFRPPLTRFGPGNRGVEYATAPGEEVRAAADGVVTFAGQVGGALHVTVEHPDRRLTSYSGVGELSVRLGQQVAAGQVVALAGGVTHVGVREQGRYVDPEVLFGAGRIAVRLVPESPLGDSAWTTPGQRAAELRLIALDLGGGGGFGVLGRVGGALMGAGGWMINGGATVLGMQLESTRWLGTSTSELVMAAAPYVAEVSWYLAPYALGAVNPYLSGVVFGILVPLAQGEVPPMLLFTFDVLESPWRTFGAVAEWWHHRQICTPESVVAEQPGGRRVAVMVAGLDSSSDGASVGELRTDELGYHEGDVIGFSYAGGRTTGHFDEETVSATGDLAHIETTDYDRAESSTGLGSRGALLADLLTEVARSAPDATVDVYAHSQGGVVARLALRELESRERGREVIERLGLVATMATPHQGADLATLAVEASTLSGGPSLLESIEAATGSTTDPRGTNLPDLSRRSDLLLELQSRPLPGGPDYLSIGASGDPVVLDRRTRLDGARQVTVPIVGAGAHGAVPGHEATTRELALGLADMGPACRGLFETMGDHLASEMVLTATSLVGLAITGATLPIGPDDLAGDLLGDPLDASVAW
ncbi:MAG: peptidoglycan DD-metalloendopeptidase family protein [Acidimicrobiales bacterium]